MPNAPRVAGQQLVRQVSLNPGSINCSLVTKSPGAASPAQPPALPASPAQPSSSASAAAGPGPESPMLVQLNHGPGSDAAAAAPHFLLANTGQKSGLVTPQLGGQMMTGLNQSTLNNKIRQQRKQSLKWQSGKK